MASAYVRIRQHGVIIRPHTSAYVISGGDLRDVAYVSMASAYVRIRQHTSSPEATCELPRKLEVAYVSIRPHTSAYVRDLRAPRKMRGCKRCARLRAESRAAHLHTSAYVSIRQHTSACVSIRQHTSAYVSIRQHTPAYASIRQHTSAYPKRHAARR